MERQQQKHRELLERLVKVREAEYQEEPNSASDG
jgi:hypothetical protein